MADLSPFVSFCLLPALLVFHPLLYLLFLMAECRRGRKRERVSETDSEEKRDEEDEDGGEGEGEGRAPVSRQGFNEEPLKFAVIEQHPYPLREGTSTSPKTRRRFLSLPVFHLSLSIPSLFVSVNSM